MRKLIFAVVALLLACQPVAPPTPTTVKEGATTDLSTIVSQALSCDPGSIAWSVVEQGGGSVTQTGLYTAPSCGAPGVKVQGTYHVLAIGCGKSVQVPLNVTEDILTLDVCGVVQPGGTLCVASPSTTPGGTVQWYAKFTYTCGDYVWTPSPPPGL